MSNKVHIDGRVGPRQGDVSSYFAPGTDARERA